MGAIGWSMVSHPSTLRIWICPEASRAQSIMGTVSGHEAAHEQVRDRDREAERSIEQERDISRERDDGFSL
tara:strand:- start:768 stop:980 length:213 start_codon:yes stop_codon:yes gene_type:complete